jgi:hypothetical protein
LVGFGQLCGFRGGGVGVRIRHAWIVADAMSPLAVGLNRGARQGTRGAAPTMVA